VTTGGHCHDDMYAVLAFPATHGRQFLSLRRREESGREAEIGMLLALEGWPRAAQEAVMQSVRRRYLLRRISEIRQVRTKGKLLVLNVSTEAGPAGIQLEKPGEGVQPFGRSGLLLVTAEGDYYVVPDRGTLPKRQQRLLALYFGD
jgi:hypothetical protein